MFALNFISIELENPFGLDAWLEVFFWARPTALLKVLLWVTFLNICLVWNWPFYFCLFYLLLVRVQFGGKAYARKLVWLRGNWRRPFALGLNFRQRPSATSQSVLTLVSSLGYKHPGSGSWKEKASERLAQLGFSEPRMPMTYPYRIFRRRWERGG